VLKPLRKYSDISKSYFYFTLALYILLLVWIVIFKANVSYFPIRIAKTRAMSITERFMNGSYPFKNIIDCPPEGSIPGRIREHFLNILVFLPLGILLPFAVKKRTSFFVPLIFILTTLAVEGFQLFTGIGGFDVTDLITNSLGGYIGMWLYDIVFSKMSGHVVNRLRFAVNMIFTPLAIFAICNTVIHFDYYL